MSYVEKMVDKICKEAPLPYYSPLIALEIVEQIIADTKKACLDSIETFSRFTHMHHSAYVEAIEEAEVKEQEK